MLICQCSHTVTGKRWQSSILLSKRMMKRKSHAFYSYLLWIYFFWNWHVYSVYFMTSNGFLMTHDSLPGMAEQAVCKGHSCSFRHNEGQLNHQQADVFSPKLHCQLQPVSALLLSSGRHPSTSSSADAHCQRSLFKMVINPARARPKILFSWTAKSTYHSPHTHIHPLEGKGRGQYILMTYQMWASSAPGPPSIMG